MPDINKIPETLVGFAVYLDSNELLGVADVELPDIEATTVEIKGAGVAGTADMPLMGHTGSMTLTLNWRTVTPKFITLAAAKALDLDIRGSIQHYDAGTGEHTTSPLKVTVKGLSKKNGLGKLDSGENMDSSAELEVVRLLIELDENKILEIDKFNYIYIVDEVDYLEGVRKDLGK